MLKYFVGGAIVATVMGGTMLGFVTGLVAISIVLMVKYA